MRWADRRHTARPAYMPPLEPEPEPLLPPAPPEEEPVLPLPLEPEPLLPVEPPLVSLDDPLLPAPEAPAPLELSDEDPDAPPEPEPEEPPPLLPAPPVLLPLVSAPLLEPLPLPPTDALYAEYSDALNFLLLSTSSCLNWLERDGSFFASDLLI